MTRTMEESNDVSSFFFIRLLFLSFEDIPNVSDNRADTQMCRTAGVTRFLGRSQRVGIHGSHRLRLRLIDGRTIGAKMLRQILVKRVDGELGSAGAFERLFLVLYCRRAGRRHETLSDFGL